MSFLIFPALRSLFSIIDPMLSPHAKSEWMTIFAIGILLSVTAIIAGLWWLSIPLFIATLCLMLFFRDPDRPIPTQRGIMVAPADGKVSSIHEVEFFEPFNGPATCVRIFLSVFDVHVNRSPIHGVVTSITHKPGEHLNVLNPESAEVNESNLIILAHPVRRDTIAAIRQVAGLCARTICCTVGTGAVVQRGQRIGIIKLGSTTELYIPARFNPQVTVEQGQYVYGGTTILANINLGPAREGEEDYEGEPAATVAEQQPQVSESTQISEQESSDTQAALTAASVVATATVVADAVDLADESTDEEEQQEDNEATDELDAIDYDKPVEKPQPIEVDPAEDVVSEGEEVSASDDEASEEDEDDDENESDDDEDAEESQAVEDESDTDEDDDVTDEDDEETEYEYVEEPDAEELEESDQDSDEEQEVGEEEVSEDEDESADDDSEDEDETEAGEDDSEDDDVTEDDESEEDDSEDDDEDQESEDDQDVEESEDEQEVEPEPAPKSKKSKSNKKKSDEDDDDSPMLF
ncbi:MAG: phosphatidylserine decarboxylase family protein [Phycisphaeraceae bacterium]|nr:phosphatidylserine decarboxylase family protein [Phycisphaeraceae bacterium]